MQWHQDYSLTRLKSHCIANQEEVLYISVRQALMPDLIRILHKLFV
jgi:hypothetical protein